ncbi:hypothetical protein Tco_1018859 [Tanacetum coccineum]|uniref:Uncharacterized protein n=1 Tax=Tanacetum coccineum TaxID=301880 RepID=A0ABQ5FW19_9ASTR
MTVMMDEDDDDDEARQLDQTWVSQQKGEARFSGDVWVQCNPPTKDDEHKSSKKPRASDALASKNNIQLFLNWMEDS